MPQQVITKGISHMIIVRAGYAGELRIRAEKWQAGVNGDLACYDADGNIVATFAPGCWAYACHADVLTRTPAQPFPLPARPRGDE